eukprot:EST42637.1 Putative zinc finger motif, C2HC5-type-containing protein [Spironucleus salmonicida]
MPPKRIYCDCHGVIHPLIECNGWALSCQNCGNIYCEQQGKGSCLFCGFDTFNLKESKDNSDLVFRSFQQSFKKDQNNEIAKQFNISELTEYPDRIDAATKEFRQLVYGNLEEIDMNREVLDDQIFQFDDFADFQEYCD